MADDLSKRGGLDRQRINVDQDFERRSWAYKFAVSQDTLRRAVAAVGDNAAEVERYLKGGRKDAKRASVPSGEGRPR